MQSNAVASLGWVTPGAATEGVTPLFFSEEPVDLIFLLIAPFRVGCHLFYLSDVVSPLFFVNLPTIFFLRMSPPWRVSPGAPALPSDATKVT